MAKKRQQTEWIFRANYSKGNFIKVGYIHNKNKGVPLDKIRLKINGKRENIEFNMRADEAMCIASGLTKVLAILFLRDYMGYLRKP